jgi:hypothetical protein
VFVDLALGPISRTNQFTNNRQIKEIKQKKTKQRKAQAKQNVSRSDRTTRHTNTKSNIKANKYTIQINRNQSEQWIKIHYELLSHF